LTGANAREMNIGAMFGCKCCDHAEAVLKWSVPYARPQRWSITLLRNQTGNKGVISDIGKMHMTEPLALWYLQNPPAEFLLSFREFLRCRARNPPTPDPSLIVHELTDNLRTGTDGAQNVSVHNLESIRFGVLGAKADNTRHTRVDCRDKSGDAHTFDRCHQRLEFDRKPAV